ncbi:uncharacterized protein LOC131604972 [Vicia villosa]|uniref:uncharacterized protein LOC131604972 n=1 Tax=Vicia villosa TaxID=3911 RepID=UPI00273AB94A|nr:uncharacterized protein LOC131604972 [Vicia villosa]
MARNDHQVQQNRGVSQRKPNIIELGTNDAILAQNKLLFQQVEELTKKMARLPQQLKELQELPNKNKQVAQCELCSGEHPTGYCPPINAGANYMGNQNQGGYQQRQAPYQNQGGYQQRQNAQPYSQGWRPENFNRQNPYQQPPPQDKPSKLEETLNQFMQASMANQKSNEAAIKNLETQVGKLAEKQTGPSFSANTQPNPKEHCKAVVTRSGRVVEALEHMPKYANFMKDILTKKKKYTEPETVILDAKCSAIIQSTLPRKESDPRRDSLPVTIGDIHVGRGLIDLGSSINLIPLSMVKRLGIFYLKAMRMTLQLADKSTTRPYGVAEDLLVKVDKFLFPVDFVVIDMEEDIDTPLILGRPFMKTAGMMIDIDDGLMKVRFQDEEVCFDLFEAMTHPSDNGDCFRIDVMEEVIMQVES